MSELSPQGGSEGYGACSDEAAAPLWNSWKARSCPALPACWTPKGFHQKSAGLFLHGHKILGRVSAPAPSFPIFRCNFF